MPVQINGNTYFRSTEVSRMTGVSKSTIHRWLHEGIIPPARFHDRNGWILFTAEDIERIRAESGVFEIEADEAIPCS